MRFYSYQQMGCLEGKKEMEDRIVAGGNILCDGLHVISQAGSGVYAVMDGVGGMHGSAYASSYVARALSDINNYPGNAEYIKMALETVHNELIEYSSTATTATGVSISSDKTILFHIGNCRLYGLYDGYIRQLTIDQTRYEDLLRQGFSPSDIPESAKCLINACLGSQKELIEQIVISDITKQIDRCSRLMITSDGIHDHVSVEDLEKFLNSTPIRPADFTGLANIAVEYGSEDDLSIMVLDL